MSTATDTSHSHLPPKDAQGARIGMWLFLFTELLLFGGLFLLYAVYRHQFAADFHFAASQLNTLMGGLNTVILLTSSLTMVLAVLQLENRKLKNAAWMLLATMGMGLVFLVNKYFEWSAKIQHGLYPNSDIMQTHTPGESVFYSLYYLMTGLHGLHILIGLVILAVMWFGVKRQLRHQEPANHEAEREDSLDRLGIKLENSGLYWHLVDVIWIFLFPLFYLIT